MVELIAVMAVIAVLSAVAVPALSGLDERRAVTAARNMQRDLQWAQQYAVARGTVTWVVFDQAGDNYALFAESLEQPGRAAAVAIEDPTTGKAFRQQLGTKDFVGTAITKVRIDGGSEIGFRPSGLPLNDSELPLRVPARVIVESNYEVRVEPLAGHVTWKGP